MLIVNCKIPGCFLTKDIKTPSPLPLRNGHLDIKDAQCDENKNGRKVSYHIISRLGAVGVQTFPSKLAKFAGKVGIELT